MISFVIGLFIGSLAGLILAAIIAVGKKAAEVVEENHFQVSSTSKVNKTGRAYAGVDL
jgi:hypothetical protein